jgi:hypothetical protein
LKKYFPILMISLFIFGAVLSSAVAGAVDNPLVNEAVSKILKTNDSFNDSFNQSANESINESFNQSVNKQISQSASLNETIPTNQKKTAAEISVSEQKFRAAPTVFLRSVNDVITKNEDGLVELYIDNPFLNEVPLNVGVRVKVPAGLHVYGQGFAQADEADTVYGVFSVPPGGARAIYINIKGDKVGTSTVNFSGLNWPGDNMENCKSISLSRPFVVKEVSKNPDEAPSSDKVGGIKTEDEGSFQAPGFGMLIAGIGLLGVYAAKRK